MTLHIFGIIFPIMKEEVRKKIFGAVASLLRPLVRLLLRNNISFGMFTDMARWVYVDVALREFGLPGRKQTNSRVSVLTGLSRKEVLRQRRQESPIDFEALAKYDRGVRVLSGWRHDRRFCNPAGKPALLPVDQGDNSFAALVKKYSGDIPARAMLDDMVNTGTVALTEEGDVLLLADAYLPRGEENVQITILGTDVAHLLATIDHNLYTEPDQPFFQRKVSYDNLPAEVLADFKLFSNGKCQSLLEEFDHWLAAHDRDINPKITGTGRKRAGVGIYYFEEDFEADSHELDTPGDMP